MSDTMTLLFAAFGGGLAGAVLQPVVSYFLQRARSGEEIRKRRERSWRRMIEAEIRRGQSAAFEGLEAAGCAARLSPVGAQDEDRATVPPAEASLWQPHRISDENLRHNVRRYHQVAGELWFGARLGNDEVKKGAGERARELERLEEEITLRMDELDWPEANE